MLTLNLFLFGALVTMIECRVARAFLINRSDQAIERLTISVVYLDSDTRAWSGPEVWSDLLQAGAARSGSRWSTRTTRKARRRGPRRWRARRTSCSMAGHEDDPWQVIPSAWVAAAQARWQAREKPKTPMTALGLDPARGGRDETVIIARYDNWFAAPLAWPGAETPDGPAVAALAVAAMRDRAPVVVDAVGIGASVYDHLSGNGVPCLAFNGAERTTARDRTGAMGFVNRRAEWWWRLREALDPAYGQDIALPPDARLRADLCAPRWRLTPRGILIEPKEEIIARIGRSPDRGDAATYALCDEAVVKRATVSGPARAETQYDPHGW